jgi:hypothetical protein
MSKVKHFHKATAPVDPLAKYEPYIRPVLIATAIFLVVLMGALYWRSRAESRVARQWQEFTSAYYESLFNDAPDSLSQYAERFPSTSAGLAAEQIAGDILLRNGLSKQFNDAKESKSDLEEAKVRFEKIVQGSAQTDLAMHERAVFSLAYTLESLRKCDEAQRWYGEILKKPNSTFAELAQRGVDRCKLAQSVDFFTALDKGTAEINTPAPDAPPAAAPSTPTEAPAEPKPETPSESKNESATEPPAADPAPSPDQKDGGAPDSPPVSGDKTSSGG